MSLAPAFVSPFGDTVATGDDRSLLQRAVDEIQRRSVGSTLGPIPATLWISRSATLAADEDDPGEIIIPPEAILTFAPGAVLTLGEGVTMNVQGRLDLGTERRFALGPGARVRLSGPLDEIHASWWDDGESGGTPVRHAVDALWDRYADGLDPALICLSGPYELTEPLLIAPPDRLASAMPGSFAVALRGRCHGRSDAMTFRVKDVASVGALDALVLTRGAVCLSMEQLGFDLTRRLGKLPVVDALRFEGDYDRSHVEGCTFLFAGSTGIHVTSFWGAWRGITGEGTASGGLGDLLGLTGRIVRTASRLIVSRCNFEGGGTDALGIRVDPTAPTMLSVSDCQFGGVFANAITFAGSELSIFGCGFDNEAIASGTGPRYADINLGSLGTLPSWVHRLRGVNAHLTVTHCRSTSPAFLAGQRVFSAGDSGGALLTGVLHEPRNVAPEDVATSIYWGDAYQQRSLFLQGCEFWAPVRLEGNAASGVVVEVGTRFENLRGARERYVGGSTSSVFKLPDPRDPRPTT